ncbi:unnamed protein product [Caenorhabditis auriculariae]|uniref:Uncharacterized protein n=1 Tax=Caenorhabditis auriculariae TaxID=2777116 RepID=A0A8S1HJA5_9PELO|nr:unnamed protein product [Caenorhabditis auriculariae]
MGSRHRQKVPIERKSRAPSCHGYRPRCETVTETYTKEVFMRPAQHGSTRRRPSSLEPYCEDRKLRDENGNRINSRHFPVVKVDCDRERPSSRVSEYFRETVDYGDFEKHRQIRREAPVSHRRPLRTSPPEVIVTSPSPRDGAQKTVLVRHSDDVPLLKPTVRTPSPTRDLPVREIRYDKKLIGHGCTPSGHRESINLYGKPPPLKAPRGHLRHIDSSSDSSVSDFGDVRNRHNIFVDAATGYPVPPCADKKGLPRININVYFKPVEKPISSNLEELDGFKPCSDFLIKKPLEIECLKREDNELQTCVIPAIPDTCSPSPTAPTPQFRTITPSSFYQQRNVERQEEIRQSSRFTDASRTCRTPEPQIIDSNLRSSSRTTTVRSNSRSESYDKTIFGEKIQRPPLPPRKESEFSSRMTPPVARGEYICHGTPKAPLACPESCRLDSPVPIRPPSVHTVYTEPLCRVPDVNLAPAVQVARICEVPRKSDYPQPVYNVPIQYGGEKAPECQPQLIKSSSSSYSRSSNTSMKSAPKCPPEPSQKDFYNQERRMEEVVHVRERYERDETVRRFYPMTSV